VIEAVAARPVAPDEAADLPGEQKREADQEQHACKLADDQCANQ